MWIIFFKISLCVMKLLWIVWYFLFNLGCKDKDGNFYDVG